MGFVLSHVHFCPACDLPCRCVHWECFGENCEQLCDVCRQTARVPSLHESPVSTRWGEGLPTFTESLPKNLCEFLIRSLRWVSAVFQARQNLGRGVR